MSGCQGAGTLVTPSQGGYFKFHKRVPAPNLRSQGSGVGSGGGSCCAGGSGRVGDVGPAGVTQLLLLVAGLVLVLVVEHSLEVHDSPCVPGLGAE